MAKCIQHMGTLTMEIALAIVGYYFAIDIAQATAETLRGILAVIGGM